MRRLLIRRRLLINLLDRLLRSGRLWCRCRWRWSYRLWRRRLLNRRRRRGNSCLLWLYRLPGWGRFVLPRPASRAKLRAFL